MHIYRLFKGFKETYTSQIASSDYSMEGSHVQVAKKTVAKSIGAKSSNYARRLVLHSAVCKVTIHLYIIYITTVSNTSR